MTPWHSFSTQCVNSLSFKGGKAVYLKNNATKESAIAKNYREFKELMKRRVFTHWMESSV